MGAGLAGAKVVKSRRRVGLRGVAGGHSLFLRVMDWRANRDASAPGSMDDIFMANWKLIGRRRCFARRAGAVCIKHFAWPARLSRRRFAGEDGDRLGENRRKVRHVVGVAKQQLQRVLPRRQTDGRFGLARAEM
jgi:hypothetical protein